MILRRRALGFSFLFFYLSIAGRLGAQPLLPDLSGSYDNSGVTLLWTCQYNSIKTISVLRSRDSVNRYELIGYVKNTERGTQTFKDPRPAPGKNYYKLSIAFSSGLTWRSNHLGIMVSTGETGPSVPLQAKGNIEKPARPDTPRLKIADTHPEKESDKVLPGRKSSQDTCAKTPQQKQRLTIVMSEDTSAKPANIPPAAPAPPKPKITLKSAGLPDMERPIIMRSRYIFTDSVSGHVDMFLPDDVAGHHYSVKFYDLQNHLIFELLRVSAAKIIFDKRNFQRKGVYKFVLRKDYTELESGYISVNPAPNP